jgi:hypothetical protein
MKAGLTRGAVRRKVSVECGSLLPLFWLATIPQA